MKGRRIDALQAQRKPPEQRIFTVLVRNHTRTDEEIARFCAEHGVTDNDLLIAQVLVQKLPLVAFLGQRLGSVRDAPGRTCDPLVPKKGVRLATLNNQRFFARLTMVVRDWLRSSCGERRSLPRSIVWPRMLRKALWRTLTLIMSSVGWGSARIHTRE